MPQSDQTNGDDASWEGLSLEELGKAYAKAVGHTDAPESSEHNESPTTPTELTDEPFTAGEPAAETGASLAAIIEGALFIGRADGNPVRESDLAALIRDVSVDDVSQEIDRLNESYKENDQALRIIRDDDGVRLGVAADLEIVRRSFYGKLREATLSQAAVEVLSLVAYQPGITAEKVENQRGRESASLLSQLVRRRLLEQRREVSGSKKITTFFPTERFLSLFNLQSLDDLPHVEE